jgi:protein-disulfide isomerase
LSDFERKKPKETGGCQVKVEVLYVAECPSHPAAVKLVKEVLAAEGVATKIQEVLVRDEGMADELRFGGSPTIRINGRDVAGESQKAESFALSCRLYPGSKQVGLPPVEVIRRAVLAARQEGRS